MLGNFISVTAFVSFQDPDTLQYSHNNLNSTRVGALHNCYGSTCVLVQYSWFSHGTSECRELLANLRRPFGFPPNWGYILRQLVSIKRLRVASKSSRAVNSCVLRRAIWIVTAPASLIAFKLFRLARDVLSAPPPAPRWGHISPTGVKFLWRTGVFTFGRTLRCNKI